MKNIVGPQILHTAPSAKCRMAETISLNPYCIITPIITFIYPYMSSAYVCLDAKLHLVVSVLKVESNLDISGSTNYY